LQEASPLDYYGLPINAEVFVVEDEALLGKQAKKALYDPTTIAGFKSTYRENARSILS